jgi:hypothetical protein
MSDAESLNGREASSVPEGGILAALPRARPQRATARRAAARRGRPAASRKPATSLATAPASLDDKQSPTKPIAKSRGKATVTLESKATTKPRAKATAKPESKNTAKPQANATAKPKAKATGRSRVKVAAKPPVKLADAPAPKQGYEPEEEVELGTTVHPPSGVELVESVADIVGELAGTGLTATGRLLKDAFSILRRP